MVRFHGLQGREVETAVEVEKEAAGETLELQEARLKQRYMEAMWAMNDNRLADSTDIFLKILGDVSLDRDVTGDARFSALRQIKYLCVKNLASVAEKLGHNEAVVEWLGEAVALDATDVTTWYRLGNSAHALGKYHIARCAFERGLTLRPQHALCLEKLCEVTYAIGDYEACIRSAEQLLEVEPTNSRVLFIKGLALSQDPRCKEEGEDIMELAQDEGYIEDQEQLRELRTKRRKVDHDGESEKPTELDIEKRTWRCVLEKTLELYQGTVALGGKSGSVLNIPVVVRLSEAIKREKGTDHDENDGRPPTCFDENAALCLRCGGDEEKDDNLLLCDKYEQCGSAVHLSCHEPPLSKVPEGDWKCVRCAALPQVADKHARAADTSVVISLIESDDSLPAVFASPKKKKPRVSDVERKDGERKSLRAQEHRPARAESFSKFLVFVAEAEESVRREALQTGQITVQGAASQQQQQQQQQQQVQEGGDKPDGEDGAESNKEIAVANKDSQGGDLTRYQMMLKVADVSTVEGRQVTDFIESLAQPCGLLELVRGLVERVAIVASTMRVRGKALEALLKLDRLTQSFFAVSAEASLSLAELHFDVQHLAHSDGNAMLADADDDGEGDGESREETEVDPRMSRMFSRHLDAICYASLEDWTSRVRVLWLQARILTMDQGPLNSMAAFQGCKSLLVQGNADPDFVILLPSSISGNVISAGSIDKRCKGPSNTLERMTFENKLAELEKKIPLKPQELGTEVDRSVNLEYQDLLIRTHVPELEKEGKFLVTGLSQYGRQNKASKEERDERLAKLYSFKMDAEDSVKDALYILNLIFAESVGLENVASELSDKDEYALFQPFEDNGKRAQLAVNLLCNFMAKKGSSLGQLGYPCTVMLQQLQVLVSRLICRLGATRYVASTFFHACLQLFRLHCVMRGSELSVQQKQDILAGMLDELIKRNVHNNSEGEFMRMYLDVLTELRIVAAQKAGEGQGEGEAMQRDEDERKDEEMQDESDEDSENEEEGDIVERELAKCYYVMFDLKINGFKDVYVEADAIFGKEDDGTPYKSASKSSREFAKNRPLALKETSLCLDVFEFVHPRIEKALAGQRNVSSSYKDVLETLVSIFPEPPSHVATSKSLITDFLSDTNSVGTLPYISFVGKVVEWMQGMPNMRELSAAGSSKQIKDGVELLSASQGPAGKQNQQQGAPLALTDARGAKQQQGQNSPIVIVIDEDDPKQVPSNNTDKGSSRSGGSELGRASTSQDALMKDADSSTGVSKQVLGREHSSEEERLTVLYRNVYWLLARCHQRSGHQSSDECARPLFLKDLWIHPHRLSSWRGLGNACNKLLHTREPYGLRFFTTLEQSVEARLMLFETLRAYCAAASIDPNDTDARGGIGLMLYLLLQGYRRGLSSDPLRRAAQISSQEFLRVLEKHPDWRTYYFLGKLAIKQGLPVEDVLKYLDMSTRLNTHGGTLGLESFYKLHATRSKVLHDVCDDVSVLEQYSLAYCLERAREASAKASVDDDEQAGGKQAVATLLCEVTDSMLIEATEEQNKFEEALGGLTGGRDMEGVKVTKRSAGVIRDVMIAIRLASIKSRQQKWPWAKGRYRLAKIMSEFQPDGKELDISREIVNTLKVLFFNEAKDQVSLQYFDTMFMQLKPREAEQATFSNIGTHMRLRNKSACLFSEHLAKLASDDALDKLDKLVELLIKVDRASSSRGRSSKDQKRSPISMWKAIHQSVSDLLKVLHSRLLSKDESVDKDDVFKRAGKLWTSANKLVQDDKDFFEGLRFQTDAGLVQEYHATSSSAPQGGSSTVVTLPITLGVQDSACPIKLTLLASYKGFCIARTLTYDSKTTTPAIMKAWTDQFGEKRNRLSLASCNVFRSPGTPKGALSASACASPSCTTPTLVARLDTMAQDSPMDSTTPSTRGSAMRQSRNGEDAQSAAQTGSIRSGGEDAQSATQTGSVRIGGEDAQSATQTGSVRIGGEDAQSATQTGSIRSGGEDAQSATQTGSVRSGGEDAQSATQTGSVRIGGEDAQSATQTGSVRIGGEDAQSATQNGPTACSGEEAQSATQSGSTRIGGEQSAIGERSEVGLGGAMEVDEQAQQTRDEIQTRDGIDVRQVSTSQATGESDEGAGQQADANVVARETAEGRKPIIIDLS